MDVLTSGGSATAGLRSRIAALEAESGLFYPLVWDNYRTKANGSIGLSGNGLTWVTTGTQILAVNGGKLRLPGVGTGYAYLSLGQTVKRIDCTFSFTAGASGNASGAVVALITGVSGTTMLNDPLTKYIHNIVTRETMSCQLYENPAATIVQPSGAYTFKSPLQLDTEYTISFEIFNGSITVTAPDGGTFSYSDARYNATNFGGRFIEEIQWLVNTQAEPQIVDIKVYGRDDTQAYSPYCTPAQVAAMIKAAVPMPVKFMRFTPDTAGAWYRIAEGPTQIGGYCSVVATDPTQFFGGSIPLAQIAYSVTHHAGNASQLVNIASGSINTPVLEFRVSGESGLASLDVKVNSLGGALDVFLWGSNATGSIPANITSGAAIRANNQLAITLP